MTDLYGPRISVVDPIGAAVEWVKVVLFRPFDPGKWFVIGFCAWLANLCEGGGGGGGGSHVSSGGPGNVGGYVHEHLAAVIIIGAIVMTLIFTIAIVCLWLSSRGHFMFLHCVAENKAEVKIPWRKYRRQGNSLFLFRLALMFIGLLVFGLIIAVGIVLGIALAKGGGPAGAIVAIVVLVLAAIPIGIAFAVVGKFLKDFVVPIMYLRDSTCMACWSEFGGLLSANKGRFAVYILFHILISMAIGMIVLVIILATCCCAGCILAIPYIGTVFALPLIMFSRSYSLCYLAQYGGEYNAFAKAAAVYEPEQSQMQAPEPEEPMSPDIEGL